MADTSADHEDEVVVPSQQPAKPWKQWMPLLVALVLTPVLSLGVTQFILIPRLKSALGVVPAQGAGGATRKASAHSGAGENGTVAAGTYSFPFDNIVVNLSGAKGTRYLKASFTVVSSNPDLKDVVTQHRIELLDLTISILSAKSLVDLEVPGAKNLLRHDLLESFNQNLKSNVIEQLYFSEFVIQ